MTLRSRILAALLILISCILDLCVTGAAGAGQPGPPEVIFITFAEGMTVGPDDKSIQTGYRMWTVPVLNEMKNKIDVQSLEVYPKNIDLKVGEVYSLRNLRVIARDAAGNIVGHTPIWISYSQWVLCHDHCNQGWEEVEPRVIDIENRQREAALIGGVRSGSIQLRITGLSHSDATCPTVYVDVTVH